MCVQIGVAKKGELIRRYLCFEAKYSMQAYDQEWGNFITATGLATEALATTQ